MNAVHTQALAAITERRALLAVGTERPWVEGVLGSEGYEVRGPAFAPEGSRIPRRPRVARCGYEAWETDKANAALIVAAVNAFERDTDALEAVLLRHEPAGDWCANQCPTPDWPCPDAQAALTALGVGQ